MSRVRPLPRIAANTICQFIDSRRVHGSCRECLGSCRDLPRTHSHSRGHSSRFGLLESSGRHCGDFRRLETWSSNGPNCWNRPNGNVRICLRKHRNYYCFLAHWESSYWIICGADFTSNRLDSKASSSNCHSNSVDRFRSRGCAYLVLFRELGADLCSWELLGANGCHLGFGEGLV